MTTTATSAVADGRRGRKRNPRNTRVASLRRVGSFRALPDEHAAIAAAAKQAGMNKSRFMVKSGLEGARAVARHMVAKAAREDRARRTGALLGAHDDARGISLQQAVDWLKVDAAKVNDATHRMHRDGDIDSLLRLRVQVQNTLDALARRL